MFQRNILLSKFSSYRIGGPAKYFFEARNLSELQLALKEAEKINEKVFILGGGTNILFRDEGFDGIVIKISLSYIRQIDSDLLIVGAGAQIKELLDYCIDNSLSGWEWAGGLPGTLGGAIRGNAGAFGGETKDGILQVISLDKKDPDKFIIRNNNECFFSYRDSIFKKSAVDEIILEAKLAVKKGDKEIIKSAIEEKINYRFERNPMDYPNCGSVFKNVDLKIFPSKFLPLVKNEIKTDPFPVVPAAFLISECGLKGVKEGGAMISSKHPNFIINYSNATAYDVRQLIRLVKEKVYDKFEVVLEEEIIIL